MKKTISLDDLFTFKESEKSLKKNPLGFLSTMSRFNEPEKKKNLTRNFGTRFKEHDQNIEISARRLFPFYGNMKKSKTNLLITKDV